MQMCKEYNKMSTNKEQRISDLRGALKESQPFNEELK